MNVQDILARLDGEISRLRQARELLVPLAEEGLLDPGRPKGIGNKQPTAGPPKQARKRQLTPAGRQWIRDAQKARWAARTSGAEYILTTEGVSGADPSA